MINIRCKMYNENMMQNRVITHLPNTPIESILNIFALHPFFILNRYLIATKLCIFQTK